MATESWKMGKRKGGKEKRLLRSRPAKQTLKATACGARAGVVGSLVCLKSRYLRKEELLWGKGLIW